MNVIYCVNEVFLFYFLYISCDKDEISEGLLVVKLVDCGIN